MQSRSNLTRDVVQLLRRKVDPQEYQDIRKLWIDHSAAEEARDIPGLTATLTEDCVYTVANTGARCSTS
jgi:hypothetical protein